MKRSARGAAAVGQVDDHFAFHLWGIQFTHLGLRGHSDHPGLSVETMDLPPILGSLDALDGVLENIDGGFGALNAFHAVRNCMHDAGFHLSALNWFAGPSRSNSVAAPVTS